jgi:hypothetical protein
MDPTFAHPKWIVVGVLLFLSGLWLFRWAARNDSASEIAAATREAAVNKLLKGAPTPPAQNKKRAAAQFRHAMSQLTGIVGFLLIIAGLLSAFLGVFYDVG